MHFAASHDGFSLLSPFYRFIVFFVFPRFLVFRPLFLSLSLSRSLRFISIVILDLAPPLR